MKLLRALKNELASEALTWVDKRLITKEQAEKILRLYDTSLPTGDKSARGYNVLMTLAALFIGLAVIVLVSANWEQIPRTVRMLGLISITTGTNLMGVRAYRGQRPKAGKRWLFLGAIFYGTSIMLIAQIYHLGEHFPDGLYWWMLGTLPLAFLTKGFILMLMSILLSYLWFVVEAGMDFMPWTFFFVMLAGIYYATKLHGSILIFFASVFGINLWLVTLSSWWLGLTKGGLDTSGESVVFSTACAMSTVIIGAWMERRALSERMKNYGAVIRLWGVRAGLVLILMFTFETSWRELLDPSGYDHPFLLVLSLVLGVGSFIFAAFYQLREKSDRETIIKLGVTGLCVIFWGVAVYAAGFGADATPGVVRIWTILTNLLAVVCGVALIIEAVYETSTAYFYMGIAVLLCLALFRYFDLIGDYIGGAVLFMVCGGILMASARFWKKFAAKTKEQKA
ncbi:MAG: DUF2157 domain-containing protein [Myxococcota bacterium]|nr:DUF2157 domain-containing protein [Myxococcota bacterium]